MIENKESIPPNNIRGLVRAFAHHIKVCEDWVAKLEQTPEPKHSLQKALPAK